MFFFKTTFTVIFFCDLAVPQPQWLTSKSKLYNYTVIPLKGWMEFVIKLN